MRLRILALVLFLASANTVQAAAGTDIECVQNQMIAMGYDIGKPDGFSGPITTNAFKSIQKKRGDQAFKFELKGAGYTILCRQLCLETPALKAFWPQHGQAFAFSSDGSLVSDILDLADRAVANAERVLTTDLAVELSDRIEVVAGSSPGVLAALARAELRKTFDTDDFHAQFQAACSAANRPNGFSQRNVIVLCLDPETMSPDKALADKMRVIVMRETLAVALHQLTGYAPPKSPEGRQNTTGPDWLRIGIAANADFLAQADQPDITRSKAVRAQQGASLAELEKVDSLTPEITAQSAFAAAVLLSESAPRCLLQFYELIGLGHAWPEAFETCFGKPVAQFYLEMAAR